MAEVWNWWGITRSGTYVEVSGTGHRIGFNGSTFGSSIGVNEFQDSTHITNDTMTVDYCTTASGHLNNCKYVSATEIDWNGNGATSLTGTITTGTECTLKIQFEEDTGATEVSNVRFYAYDGVTPTTGPSGVKAVGFEWTSGGINNDSPQGAGKAWDNTAGINNSANKLVMDDQGSSNEHDFWIGVSSSPTSVGLKTAFVYRIELDYQ